MNSIQEAVLLTALANADSEGVCRFPASYIPEIVNQLRQGNDAVSLESVLGENPVRVAICHGLFQLFREPMDGMWVVTTGAKRTIHKGDDFRTAFDVWAGKIVAR